MAKPGPTRARARGFLSDAVRGGLGAPPRSSETLIYSAPWVHGHQRTACGGLSRDEAPSSARIAGVPQAQKLSCTLIIQHPEGATRASGGLLPQSVAGERVRTSSHTSRLQRLGISPETAPSGRGAQLILALPAMPWLRTRVPRCLVAHLGRGAGRSIRPRGDPPAEYPRGTRGGAATRPQRRHQNQQAPKPFAVPPTGRLAVGVPLNFWN